jgi:deoxyribodipyrimidine photo-lyase
MDVSVVWFRRDLRLADNEMVAKAVAAHRHCLFVYVLDPWFFKQPEIGWLRVKFLFESLSALDNELAAQAHRLVILSGESVTMMLHLLDTLRRKSYRPHLYFNQDIQVSYGKERDEAIQSYCQNNSIELTQTSNYFLLHDEQHMQSWWKQYYAYQHDEKYIHPSLQASDHDLQAVVSRLPHINPQQIAETLHLTLPAGQQTTFQGGETAARAATYSFLRNRSDGYRWKISRPYLVQQGATSLLGPHLAFGTISNRTVYQAAYHYRAKLAQLRPKKAFDLATYMDRLRWRDSFTQRLWFHPELMWENRFKEFDGIYNQGALSGQQQAYLDRWIAGETGFPLLDAAMKQLSADGFINFRMRAMAATFLTINCGVSWHHGARHFMQCLVDGDIAINHWQWQMQAGITNPLSPTFRIYSPTKNLRDRDPSAAYVHTWLPETRNESVETILQAAHPMLDFKETRLKNGKVISDIRKQVRARLQSSKGLELLQAQSAERVVKNYRAYSTDRYKRYS